MSRDEIKAIVYEYARIHFSNPENFDAIIMNKPFDGENELICKELFFDSLDMIEFSMELEDEFNHKFTFDDNFIDNNITLGKLIDYIDNKINKENKEQDEQ